MLGVVVVIVSYWNSAVSLRGDVCKDGDELGDTGVTCWVRIVMSGEAC